MLLFSLSIGSVLGAGRTKWSEEGGGAGGEHRVTPGQKLDEGPGARLSDVTGWSDSWGLLLHSLPDSICMGPTEDDRLTIIPWDPMLVSCNTFHIFTKL